MTAADGYSPARAATAPGSGAAWKVADVAPRCAGTLAESEVASLLDAARSLRVRRLGREVTGEGALA